MGTLARLLLLRRDYRQFPSYPQGYTIHLSLGFIAAALGAIAPPAIIQGDLAAASFLALAATQFREVRSVERETLRNVENTELVPRGTAYIEGIARVFEARNYLAMLTGLAASMASTAVSEQGLLWSAGAGAAAGLLIGIALYRAMGGRRVGDIAVVKPAAIEFDGPLLTVAGVTIMNVGLDSARRRYMDEGLAVVIEPKDANARATLANLGQRQAIAHEVATVLGIKLEVDEREFTPIARQNPDTGEVVMAIVPLLNDERALVRAVEYVPVLEGTVRKPVQSGLWPPDLASLERATGQVSRR
ncbi:MAG: YIEGIA domain-containing protein [Firmicutes bacterium]|nr:YIEGIA domain-containing protein [Bacillota bacterium]